MIIKKLFITIIISTATMIIIITIIYNDNYCNYKSKSRPASKNPTVETLLLYRCGFHFKF